MCTVCRRSGGHELSLLFDQFCPQVADCKRSNVGPLLTPSFQKIEGEGVPHPVTYRLRFKSGTLSPHYLVPRSRRVIFPQFDLLYIGVTSRVEDDDQTEIQRRVHDFGGGGDVRDPSADAEAV